MTWKEFKELVEANGVEDDTEINYIDIGRSSMDHASIEVQEEGHGEVAIWGSLGSTRRRAGGWSDAQ